MTEIDRLRIMNPVLALTNLYKQQGKKFDDVLTDILARLKEFGIIIDKVFLVDKVLPWVYSLMFITTADAILGEVIASLSVKPGTKG